MGQEGKEKSSLFWDSVKPEKQLMPGFSETRPNTDPPRVFHLCASGTWTAGSLSDPKLLTSPAPEPPRSSRGHPPVQSLVPGLLRVLPSLVTGAVSCVLWEIMHQSQETKKNGCLIHPQMNRLLLLLQLCTTVYFTVRLDAFKFNSFW